MVLIVKENRTYDEVFGDIVRPSNGPCRSSRTGAAGHDGLCVDGKRQRGSACRDINVTPNHQAMAAQWAISDNFYADSDVSVDGHHWLVGLVSERLDGDRRSWRRTASRRRISVSATAPGRLLFAG